MAQVGRLQTDLYKSMLQIYVEINPRASHALLVDLFVAGQLTCAARRVAQSSEAKVWLSPGAHMAPCHSDLRVLFLEVCPRQQAEESGGNKDRSSP